ncbi:MAG: hypothetical protein K9M13_02035 [Simkaniaceae bacterium]|nr:hypothetical protein [Simkaniaceae bacterium]
MFADFGDVVQKMQDEKFEVVRSRGTLALQQTQRNKMKAQLMEGLYKGFQEVGGEYGFDVYMTSDGVIFEVKNQDVLKKVNRMKDKQHEEDIQGYISLEFNVKIKNLDYDAEVEEEAYLAAIEEAKKKEAEKEIQKRQKIQRDAEMRAGRARIREQKILSLLKEDE